MSEIRRVEDVQRFRAELQAHTLANLLQGESAPQAHVRHDETGPAVGVAADIAEGPR